MTEADQARTIHENEVNTETAIGIDSVMPETVETTNPENEEQALQPIEVGLDRVPTRLSSSDLERRQEEEENEQNLVEEILNSTSSEVDFILGNTDRLASPK